MGEVNSDLPPGTYTISGDPGLLTVTGYGVIQGSNGSHARMGNYGFYAATSGSNGVDALHFAVINNDGQISGGSGGETFLREGGYTQAGSGAIGIDFSANGTLNNSGIVSGGAGGYSYYGAGGAGAAGVVFEGTGTITNSGAIIGGDGGSVSPSHGTVGGAGGDGVVLASGGSISDTAWIIGGNGGSFAAGGVGVDLALGGRLTLGSTGYVVGGAGGSGGAGVDSNGGTIITAGTIEGGAGGPAGVGVDVNGGTLDVEQGGTVTGGAGKYGAAGGAGVYLNGGTLTTAGNIDGGAGATRGDSINFGAVPATMFVEAGAHFSGVIGGFHFGDSIDLTNLSPAAVYGDFNHSTDTITTGVDGTLQFAGDPKLIFSSDGDGGTLVTCACFRRGTLILAERGQCLVESLEIGDRVMTLSGELKPIRWIGQRHYSGQALLDRPDVMPVLVHAGALGDHLPRRDLWVSPEHALYLSGSLVPAGLLTNGVSILTDDSVSSVSYYHLEFESHEVVFAEGAPAESFVDDDSRQMFDNAADYSRRYPDAPRQSAVFCAPRVEDGEELEILRVRLAELASIPTVRLTGVMSASSQISS